jgi:hypothetical protein
MCLRRVSILSGFRRIKRCKGLQEDVLRQQIAALAHDRRSHNGCGLVFFMVSSSAVATIWRAGAKEPMPGATLPA